MHDQLPSTIKRLNLLSKRGNAMPSMNRDARLHRAYSEWSANDYHLHVRRTLDQFWYTNVDTRERDGDQVVQRYQPREQESQDSQQNSTDVDSLIIDQLWIWILGPSLIVTSFPQDWQQSRDEMPDLLSSILEEIDPRAGAPVQSVYELGACIVGHCLSFCDQSADHKGKPSVLEMFGSSVGKVMNQEVMLFHRFKEASVKASEWVKSTLLENGGDDHRRLQDLENEYASEVARTATLHFERPKSSDHRDRTGTDEPTFVEDLLDIHDETSLLEEVKDIQDELGILLPVVEDQKGVNRDMRKALESLLKSNNKPVQLRTLTPLPKLEHEPYQSRTMAMLIDQCVSLDQQKAEIENMSQQVKGTYKSITDLLDHKQKHANAIEARYARKQASDTAKAGRTLMVFTIVTVIFLPLSFLRRSSPSRSTSSRMTAKARYLWDSS